MWRRAGARLAGQLRRARNSAQDAFQSSSVSRRVLFAIGGGSGAYGVSLMLTALGAPSKDAELLKKGNQAATEHDDDPEAFEKAGSWKDGLPEYTEEEVRKHNTAANRLWVTYKNGVYDITDFVAMHPGGDKILLAKGASLEPFWSMYQQHRTGFVANILEELRVGNIKVQPKPAGAADASDPYANDPQRHPALVVRSAKPFNAETPPALQAESQLTPNELFYVRNHLPVPLVDPETYVLSISSDKLQQPIKLTLNDLKTLFPRVEVEAAIQCAGNRRNEMTKIKPVKGGAWDFGAISNAKWAGAKLRDVLAYVGVDPNSVDFEHVHFEGLDRDFEKHYGASIPWTKAIAPDGDVILAYEMNGQTLPRDHGFPVRAVVPGIVGARNVKWLAKVHASKDESPNHWQQLDYKGFCPSVDWHNVDFKSSPAIQELPVQSAITQPVEGYIVEPSAKEVEMKGFAWSGGGRGIVRVDVSTDGGQNWTTADLSAPENQRWNHVWGWTLWKAQVPLPERPVALDEKGDRKYELVVKAVDSSYNTQPDTMEPIWNLRGVLANSWHRVRIAQPASEHKNKDK